MIYETWYDRSLRLWTTIKIDLDGNQVGAAGYGMTKTESKDDCEYHTECNREFT